MNKIYYLLFLASIILASCEKNEDEQIVPHENVILKDNVKVIDSLELNLNLDESLLNPGNYQFEFSGSEPNVNPGDIIVGAQGEGFIRKVISKTIDGNILKLQTIQGTFEDVFKSGSFSFNSAMESSRQVAENGFNYTFTPTNLYDNNGINITLQNGSLNFSPNWNFDFNFENGSIQHFKIGFDQAILNMNLSASLTATGEINLPEQIASLYEINRKKVFWIPTATIPIPVVVKFKIELIANTQFNASASITRIASIESTNTASLGLEYINSVWNKTQSFQNENSFSLSDFSGQANYNFNLGISPKVDILLYGVAGPYFMLGVQTDTRGSVSLPLTTESDWDLSADGYLKAKAGASATILGSTLAEYTSPDLNSNTIRIYETPNKIEKLSGDNQTTISGQQLSQPLRVRVLDNLGNTVKSTPVHFEIIEGGGQIFQEIVLTDDFGISETNWILGSENIQKVKATIKKGDGTVIANSPVIFTATTTSSICDNFNDIEGNVYPSVTIGSKCWMQKNLNVSKYRNGDIIPQIQDPYEWANATSGAWCYYQNSASNGLIYGKLYNWYAVNDPRGLAPEGWHIATNSEWNELQNNLGGGAIAGGKLKSTTGWTLPNIASNESNFNALPGGYRYYSSDANFYNLGVAATWWSSTLIASNNGGWWYVTNNQTELVNGGSGMTTAASIRCVKD